MPEQYLQGNQGAEEHGFDRNHRKIFDECLRQTPGHLKANDKGRDQKASQKVTIFKQCMCSMIFFT
jgi:hypothetical protein